MLGEGDVNGSGPRAAHGAGVLPGQVLGPGVQICFAGLGLSLEGDSELCSRWQRAAGGSHAPGTRAGPGAPLRCHLRPLTAGVLPQPRGLGWEWNEPCGRVHAPHGEACVRREGGVFTADVRVAREPRAARLLLVGLTSLLLHLRGGLLLHAASISLDGGAIAFIGPSGAGKSTASRHVSAGKHFSVDRLALLPGARGGSAPWLAHPLPGGSARDDAQGVAPGWLPLRALLRVHPSPLGSRIEACPPALAVLLARESAFQLGRGAGAESALLGTLEQLARDVGVDRLHVRLGTDLTSLLRARGSRAEEETT